MATTVCDVAVGGAAVGSGELISEVSYEVMVNPGTVGVGERSDDCPSCTPMTEELHFGMGVTVAGDWIVQTPLFAGIGGVAAYLSSEDLSIAIANTYDQVGDVSVNGSTEILERIAPVLVPDAELPDL